MNAALLTESIRIALGEIISLIDPAANTEGPIAVLHKSYEDAVQHFSKAVVGRKLGISADSVTKLVSDPVNLAVQACGNPDTTFIAVTGLRCLLLLEPILQRKLSHDAPLLTEPLTDEDQARRQVRALELILRAMIRERYGDEERLVERLRFLFANAPKDLARWFHTADPGNILSGMVLADLAKLFTHESEWDQYAGLYDRVQVLHLASDRRRTIEQYLIDVNTVRNQVAHHKHLTRVQIELLNLYYGELVEPIQRLFRSGSTAVNPEAIANANKEIVDRYLSSLRDEVTAIISRKTKVIFWLAVAVLLTLVGAISTHLISERSEQHSLALEYQSLGWVTVSTTLGSNRTIDVQARPFLGDGAEHYEEVMLVAVVGLADNTHRIIDLSHKLDIVQAGAQEDVRFNIPGNAKTLAFCLIVPSSNLQAKYRVTQLFQLTQGHGSLNPIPISSRVVTREDGSSCTHPES